MLNPFFVAARLVSRSALRVAVTPPASISVKIEQQVFFVEQTDKKALLTGILKKQNIQRALVFTRTKHRANRLAEFLEKNGVSVAKIHGNRSQNQRTEALADFKSGRIQVLVATDIVARGIDVEALGHVVNFDVPNVPDDYIHRVGRTARAETTGDAFTFVSPDEEGDLAAIERAVGRRLPRVTLPGFDYAKKTTERLEIPLGERLAAHRAKRSGERQRTAAKDARRAPSGPAARHAPHRTSEAPAPQAEKPGSPRLHRLHPGGRRSRH